MERLPTQQMILFAVEQNIDGKKNVELKYFIFMKKINTSFMNSCEISGSLSVTRGSLSETSGSLSPRHGASSGCGWRNGLQIWRVAANVLKKQSRTADKGWSSSLAVGRGANNSSS